MMSLCPSIADVSGRGRRAFIGVRRVIPVAASLIALAQIALALATSPAAAAGSGAAPPRRPKASLDLNADGSAPDRIVKSGTQASIATVWDCALPNFAPVVSARVEHGTVAVLKGDGPNCGRPEMSLTMILYRPTPGFRGTDTLTVLAFLTHGDIDQTFTILVK
jgi:hypothetical protein